MFVVEGLGVHRAAATCSAAIAGAAPAGRRLISSAKVVDVAPQCPALARASRVRGVVILQATIDSRGNVGRNGPPIDSPARSGGADAVRQWFTPTLNGMAVR